MIFRKPDRSSKDFEHELLILAKRERECLRRLEEAADPRPVLPPPEELRRQTQATMRQYYAATALPRQSMRRQKREQIACIVLFAVLSLATIAAAMWMLRLAQM